MVTRRLVAIAAAGGSLAMAACGGGDAGVALPGLEGRDDATTITAPPVPTTGAPPATVEPADDADVDDTEVAASDDGDGADEPAGESTATDEGEAVTSDAPTTTSAADPSSAETDAPPPDAPPADDVFLRRGDEGPEVAAMQRRLITLEYLAPGSDTGVFDGATADALIDFQAQYGLIVDGIFGPQTDRALNAAAASVADG